MDLEFQRYREDFKSLEIQPENMQKVIKSLNISGIKEI